MSLLAAHRLVTEIQKRVEKDEGIKLSIHLDPTYSLLKNDEINRQINQLEKQEIYEYDDF